MRLLLENGGVGSVTRSTLPNKASSVGGLALHIGSGHVSLTVPFSVYTDASTPTH